MTSYRIRRYTVEVGRLVERADGKFALMEDVDAAFELERRAARKLDNGEVKRIATQMGWTPPIGEQPLGDSAAASLGPLSRSTESCSLPPDMLDRIEASLQRHLNDHAPKRIPADPTDADLVLYDLRQLRQGKLPRWAQPPQGGSEVAS